MVREEDFYDYVYKTFYNFADVKPEDAGILFSKTSTYPILESVKDPVMVMPLPKLVNQKYVFEGMVFENTPEERRNMWTLFLATIYHLSAHAATSPYSKYEKWIKRKTPDVCWQVIDFIEDVLADRYIHHKDPEVWENIDKLKKHILEKSKDGVNHLLDDNSAIAFQTLCDNSTVASARDEIIQNIGKAGFEEKLLSTATFLYKNQESIKKVTLPFQDHHKRSWSPKIEQVGLVFEPFGIFEEQVEKLDNLWEQNEWIKRKMLKRYSKYLKGLHFDSIIIPAGDLKTYEQIKLRTLPMLRRIRQQIRMVSNLVDDPKLDQIGYIDMQMAVQAIASEGSTSDIFERDELRRGEEAWVILIDKSASMQLRFDKLQEFTVAVSDSANELTGKADAWALYSFDNNFYVIKDFKERYNQETKARIGNIAQGGLSLLPDAIELATRILNDDPRERKFIFVITDGHPSGYDRIHEAFSKTMKKSEMSGITLIGIGITKAITRRFKNSARATDLKDLVIKFITAYKTAASSDI
jgi:uncharacterized protein YegL